MSKQIDIPKKTEEIKAKLSQKNPEKILPKLISENDRGVRETVGKCFYEMYPETGGIENFIDENITDKNLGELIKGLFEERSTTAAKRIVDAVGLFSVDEQPIYEMLFNYPRWLKNEIQNKYRNLTGRFLRRDLESGFIEPVKSNIERFLHTERNEKKELPANPNNPILEEFTKMLVEKDPTTWMTNNDIMHLFAELSPEELIYCLRNYYTQKGEGILDTISNLSASQKVFLTNLLEYVICPPLKYADQINKLLEQKSTLDYEIQKNILDIVLSRADVDLPLINKFYMMKYGKDLRDVFASAVPGYPKTPLYEVLNSMLTQSINAEVYKKK